MNHQQLSLEGTRHRTLDQAIATFTGTIQKRVAEGLDHSPLENIEDIGKLRTALISYKGFMTTLQSVQKSWLGFLENDPIILESLNQSHLGTIDIRTPEEKILDNIRGLFSWLMSLSEENTIRRNEITHRMQALANGTARTLEHGDFPRNGKLYLYNKECEDIVMEHFPELNYMISNTPLRPTSETLS